MCFFVKIIIMYTKERTLLNPESVKCGKEGLMVTRLRVWLAWLMDGMGGSEAGPQSSSGDPPTDPEECS